MEKINRLIDELFNELDSDLPRNPLYRRLHRTLRAFRIRAKISEGSIVPKPKPKREIQKSKIKVEPVPEAISLEDRNIKQLRAMAKSRNVANYSTMKKAELIEALSND